MVNLEKRFERLENLICCTQKEVLNIDEVCVLTGLSKSTIYKMTMKGDGIPFYKQMKHLFFNRVEVINWLQENRGINQAEAEQAASTALNLNKKGARV